MTVKEVLDASIVVMIMSLLTITLVLHVEFSLAIAKAVKSMESGKVSAILVFLATSLLMVPAVFFAQAKLINARIATRLVDLE
jgi:uncharacterized RDD family membrane protein YckC